jgi:Putative adhesin
MNRATVGLFVFAALLVRGEAAAQERVTVPLSDPAQPANVKVRLISGSITVTVGSGPQVVVEEQGGRVEREPNPPNIPPGMHRIDLGSRGFSVEEDHNSVTISPQRGQAGNLTIQVPVNTSVDLKTVNGSFIQVTGIRGEMDVENTNGSIELKDVSGPVTAHTVNGSVTVNLARVVPDKPMSFSSLNGRLDVTLPSDTKARLRLKTSNGSIFTDFDVKMEPDSSKPVVEDSRGQGGRYRIRMDRSTGVLGSINGGGPEYSFQTMNGSILIHKK